MAIAVDAVALAATEAAVVVAVEASVTEAVAVSAADVAVVEIEVAVAALAVAEVALALVPRSLSSPIPVSQESSSLVERMISFLPRTQPLESQSTTRSVFQQK